MKNPSSKTSSATRSFSLRTRLILGNMIVTFLAVAGLGYYVYYRAQQANSYLASQLNASVRQQAETQLNAVSAQQAAVFNNFFDSASMNIAMIGTTADNLLSQQISLDNGSYWDASKSLTRLPKGSWDNSSTDQASVFVPAQKDITGSLLSELNAIKHLDFTVPAILKANPNIVALYFGSTSGETLYYPNIDLASLVPPDFDVTGRPWFTNATPAQNPEHRSVWSDPYLDAASHGLIVTSSSPVYDSSGTFRGVVAMDFQLNKITDFVSGTRIGETGYAFLIDKNHKLIAMPSSGYKEFGISPSAVPLGQALDPAKVSAQVSKGFWDVLNKMGSGQSGLETIQVNGAEHFIAYSPLPSVGYSLAIIVPSQELLAGATLAQEQIAQSARNTLIFSAFLIMGILAVSLLAAFGISGALMSPLQALTRTAEEITAGNLQATANIHAQDEIGTLANALNTMTSTLGASIQSLEQRVKERTFALEDASRNADRRARQFEALSQATRAMSSIRNINELLPLVTSVISEYFDYYHIGIFLNNESEGFTYLTAANSEGGQRMLEHNHSLKIGEQGIVGHVAAANEVRIAHKVGDDAVFFNNPDLPETKSEAALPLHSANRVIGVLDLQSTKENAFSQDDINVLAVLADQVSLAIENARSFETTQRSLTEAETLYRQYLRQAWSRLPREQQLAGYRYSQRITTPLEIPIIFDADEKKGGEKVGEAGARLNVPIKLRGEIIGNLIVHVAQDKNWNQDQIDLVEAVADRVALSAENARLFDETSRRAERERMVTEITSKIRSTNDPEAMIRTALDELRNALGATQVQLIPQAISASQQNESKIISSTPQDLAQKTQRGNGARK